MAGAASGVCQGVAGRASRLLERHTEQAGEGDRRGSTGVRDVKAEEAAGHLSAKGLLGERGAVFLLV